MTSCIGKTKPRIKNMSALKVRQFAINITCTTFSEKNLVLVELLPHCWCVCLYRTYYRLRLHVMITGNRLAQRECRGVQKK